jgi:hypothetical protein
MKCDLLVRNSANFRNRTKYKQEMRRKRAGAACVHQFLHPGGFEPAATMQAVIGE